MLWLSSELPPDIPAACVTLAAERYAMPEALLVAVLHQEAGKVGKAYERKHGTYYGPFQISDKWLPHFAKWGFDAETLQHNACANVIAGAYVLAYYKVRESKWEDAIARYNVGSLNTPEQLEAGARYASKVVSRWWGLYEKWKNPL